MDRTSIEFGSNLNFRCRRIVSLVLWAPVESVTFSLTTGEVELGKLLKAARAVNSGGQAKWMIREGLVRVNDTVETRVKCKIHPQDRVIVDNVLTIQCI